MKEYLETSKDDTWKPCILCGGELTQIRKALFTCLKCNQEYIADEKDLREERPLSIHKLKKTPPGNPKEITQEKVN